MMAPIKPITNPIRQTQPADDAQERHVGQPDRQVELIELAQQREQPYPDRGSQKAAGKQHQCERKIDPVAPPV
jgi:hypothetical protein